MSVFCKVNVRPQRWDGESQSHHKWCKFCKPKKVYAKWSVTIRDFGRKQYASCDEHKHLLPDHYMRDTGLMSEADFLTWGGRR